MHVTFVEMPWFTRRLRDRLDDAAYRLLQRDLLTDPEKGAVMPGCGGLRKVRCGDPARGKGKSGGVRVIYLWIPEACRIDLFDVYGKSEKADLSADERKQLAGRVKQVRAEAVRAHEKQGGVR